MTDTRERFEALARGLPANGWFKTPDTKDGYVDGVTNVAFQVFVAATESLTAENAALRACLESIPIISKYYGMNGFEYDRYVDDYASWARGRMKALASGGER